MGVYFKGCSGIESPVDFDGVKISEGDLLTFDYLDPEHGGDISKFAGRPLFRVEAHKSGDGLVGVGIDKELYLHDFRFKWCRIASRHIN